MRWLLVIVALTFTSIHALGVSRITPSAVASCSWDFPGVHPYRLDPVKALDDYPLNPLVKAKLKAKMAKRQYDDFVTIDKNSIKSEKQSYTNLRDMHYAGGKVCRGEVIRTGWKDDMLQRALIYCEGEVCIAVPTVCNNVSLIDKLAGLPALPPEAFVLPPSEVFPPLFPVLPVAAPPGDVLAFCNCSSGDLYGPGPVFYGGDDGFIGFIPPGGFGSGFFPPPLVVAVPEVTTASLIVWGLIFFILLKVFKSAEVPKPSSNPSLSLNTPKTTMIVVSLCGKNPLYLPVNLLSFLFKTDSMPRNAAGFAVAAQQSHLKEPATLDIDFDFEATLNLVLEGDGWEDVVIEIGSQLYFDRQGKLILITPP